MRPMPVRTTRPRAAPLVPALLVLALLAPATLRAQDTTRTRADSARARGDTARAVRDTTLPRRDSVQVRIPLPPPAPLPWRFQLDFGFQDVSGNRNLTVFNSAFTVERRQQDRFTMTNKIEARYGKSNGVEAVNYQAIGLRFDWHPRAPISPFLGLDVQRDLIRKIEVRAQGGMGANFNLDTRDDRRTYVSVGLVFDHQQLTPDVSPRTADDTRFYLRAARTRLLGPTTRIELTAKIQPSTRDLGDYLASGLAIVRLNVTRRLGLALRFEILRDSKPAPGVSPNDRSLSASLSLAW
jgi:hypothetical protein